MGTMGSHLRLVLICLALLLSIAPLAAAGSASDPEITDPVGDAEHIEFKHQEPTLDVEAVWFGWNGQDLVVTLQVPEAQGFGPDHTEDALDEAAHYDVYWTMDGEDYVARAVVDGAGATFQAGQAMRVDRQLMWGPDEDVHGQLTAVEGGLQTGAPAWVVVVVDPATVGEPGPGSVLEDPAFSTYVDHHPPVEVQHHPGHVDQSEGAGRAYTIPAPAQDEGPATDEDPEETDDAPLVGPAALVGTLAVLALRRRD